MFCLSHWDFLNHGGSCYALDNFGKLLMSSGALTWLETVWRYGVEAIDYWTIFSMIIKSNQNWKLYWNLEVFLVLLESPWQVRFNRVCFTISRAKVWNISKFWARFCCQKFKQIAKNWVFKGKMSWAVDVPMAQTTLVCRMFTNGPKALLFLSWYELV